MRVSGSRPLELIARAYIFVFRGTPLLIQLFVVYYGLASFAFIRASFLWPFLRDAFSCAVLSLASTEDTSLAKGTLSLLPEHIPVARFEIVALEFHFLDAFEQVAASLLRKTARQAIFLKLVSDVAASG